MELAEAIRHRRSVREYTSERVSRDVLRRLIDAAIQAPSARNEQIWRFTVVTDPALIDEIGKKAKAYILDAMTAPDFVVYRPMLANDSFDVFYHAPALVIVTAPAHAQWGTEDCAMAAQTLMLSAADLGLGSCWIGFAQMWLNTPAGKKTLDIGADETVVAPIIVGHPKTYPAPTPRNEPTIRWFEKA